MFCVKQCVHRYVKHTACERSEFEIRIQKEEFNWSIRHFFYKTAHFYLV